MPAHYATLCKACLSFQVQAENMQQAEALFRVTNKLESLDTDLRDTQQLIGALHGKLIGSQLHLLG